MAEIFKPTLDFNDDEALLNYIKENPVEKIHEPVPEDSTFSISDFKSRRAEDLEDVYEWTLGNSEFSKAVTKNLEDLAYDQVIDRLREDANTLYSGFLTANDLEKAPQEIKDSYGIILQDWENTNPEGFENEREFEIRELETQLRDLQRQIDSLEKEHFFFKNYSFLILNN